MKNLNYLAIIDIYKFLKLLLNYQKNLSILITLGIVTKLFVI